MVKVQRNQVGWRVAGIAIAALAFSCSMALAAPPKTIEPGKLTIGMNGDMPMTQIKDGKLSGTDGDLMVWVANKLGLTPAPQQMDWAARYWERARAAGVPVPPDFAELWRTMEWIGLQRSLKVLGIFARLYHRDRKDRYLADLPLVMRHARRVVERYAAFEGLRRLLDRLEQEPSR